MAKQETFKNISQTNFYNSLCKRPKCTNNLKAGFLIRGKKSAIKFRYIEQNKRLVFYFIFDIDRPMAGAAWIDADLPIPTFTIKNSRNGHAHLLYSLATPYSTTDKSSLKIIKYASAIEYAYKVRLGADMQYGNALYVKNPLSEEWGTITNDVSYSFAELVSWLDIDELKRPKKPKRPTISEINDDEYYGRNHKLFTIGRKFAYSLKAKSLREDNSEAFSLQAISDYLTENNNKFLPVSEIRSISKSIFKYVNKNLSKEGLIAWQDKRTKASNRKATERSQAKRKLAARLYENGYPIKEISKEFDISYSIVRVAVSHIKNMDKSAAGRVKTIAQRLIMEEKMGKAQWKAIAPTCILKDEFKKIHNNIN